MQSRKAVASKPLFARLSTEVLHQQLDLAVTELLGERDEQVRLTEVAIVLEYFVFQNQMISECVPGQIRQYPMILMPVISVVRENQVWIELRLDLLKPVLN